MLLLALTVAACGGDGEVAGETRLSPPPVTTPATPSDAPVIEDETDIAEAEEPPVRVDVTVTNGEATGDTGRAEVPLGSQVLLVVTADVADEVHVHGYDRTVPVAPNEPTQVQFLADTPGVFEVELHDAKLLLTRLQVR